MTVQAVGTGTASLVEKGTQDALAKASRAMEAVFLAEMLSLAGLGKSSERMGGGIGEEQFGSLLVQAQAREIVNAGGIGLADVLFRQLLERENGR